MILPWLPRRGNNCMFFNSPIQKKKENVFKDINHLLRYFSHQRDWSFEMIRLSFIWQQGELVGHKLSCKVLHELWAAATAAAAEAEGFLFIYFILLFIIIFLLPSNVFHQLFNKTGAASFVCCHVRSAYTKHSNSSAQSFALMEGKNKAMCRRREMPVHPPFSPPATLSSSFSLYRNVTCWRLHKK